MGRKSDISSVYAKNINGAGGANSTPIIVLGCVAATVSIRGTPGGTNTLNGTFTLQVSDFGEGSDRQPYTADGAGGYPASTDWVNHPVATIAGSAVSGTPGNAQSWFLGTLPNKWLRVSFADSGGTSGNFDVAVTLHILAGDE